MTKLFKNYLLRFMPAVLPPTTLSPLVPSQATDGQQERELWTTPELPSAFSYQEARHGIQTNSIFLLLFKRKDTDGGDWKH